MSTLRKKLHQKNEIEHLREAVRKAESQLEEAKRLREENRELHKQYRKCLENATRYEDLRELEVLIMDSKEGVKNLSGEALDAYLDRKSARDIQSIVERSFGDIYTKRLATCMTEAKELIVSNLIVEQIRKMSNDTRSKS